VRRRQHGLFLSARRGAERETGGGSRCRRVHARRPYLRDGVRVTLLPSPHDLRHRRISLLHSQWRSWAEIGRLVGQRKLSITADTYTHVLTDGREFDYGEMIA
jgi:integrase